MESSDRLEVLKQLERGEINAGEAEARLTAPAPVERVDTPPLDRTQLPAWVWQLGIWTLSAGVLVVVSGAWIIATTVRANILWLLFGVPIVLLGSLIIAIGASTFAGHWLYSTSTSKMRATGANRFAWVFLFQWGCSV